MLHRLLLVLLSVLSSADGSYAADHSRPLSPTGIWRIETQPPAGASKLCTGFLPNGTRVGLHVPSNRLGLMPPLSAQLCALPLGQPFPDGQRLCQAAALAADPNEPYTFDDAYFADFTLTADQVRRGAHAIQQRQGAVLGSPFVYIFLRQRVGDWTIFLKSREQMVSDCDAILQNGEVATFPMVWHRQPGR